MVWRGMVRHAVLGCTMPYFSVLCYIIVCYAIMLYAILTYTVLNTIHTSCSARGNCNDVLMDHDFNVCVLI